MKCWNCEERCDKCHVRMNKDNVGLPRYTQLMEAPRSVRAVYVHDGGRTSDCQVDLIALTEEGGVKFLASDDDGNFNEPDECENFIGFWFALSPPSEEWIAYRTHEWGKRQERRKANLKKKLEAAS